MPRAALGGKECWDWAKWSNSECLIISPDSASTRLRCFRRNCSKNIGELRGVNEKAIALLVVLSLAAGGWLHQQIPAHAYTLKNRALYFLKVDNSISVPFSQLSGSMTQKGILKRYSRLGLDRGYEPSNLGERSCYASVKKVNDVDAWFVVFFFEKARLRQVKLDVMPDAHKAMMHSLTDRFGTGRTCRMRMVPKYWCTG